MIPQIKFIQLTDPTQPYGSNAKTAFALLKGESEKLLSTIFRYCLAQDNTARLSLVCKKWAIERREQCLLHRLSLGQCSRTRLQYTRPGDSSFSPCLLPDGKIGFYRGTNGHPVSAPLSFEQEFVVYDTRSQAILSTNQVNSLWNWSIRPNETTLYKGVQGSVWEIPIFTKAEGHIIVSNINPETIWAKDFQRLFILTEEKQRTMLNPSGETRLTLSCFYQSKFKLEILKHPENGVYCCPPDYHLYDLQVDQNHVWVSFANESHKKFKFHWVANQEGTFSFTVTPPQVPFDCQHHEKYTITNTTIRDENNQIVLEHRGILNYAIAPGYIFYYISENDTLYGINTTTHHTTSWPFTSFRNKEGSPAKVRLTYLRDSYLLIEEDHQSSETRNFGIFDFIQGKFTSRQKITGHTRFCSGNFFNGEQLLVWLSADHLELFDFTDRPTDLTEETMNFQFIREATKTKLVTMNTFTREQSQEKVATLRKRHGFSSRSKSD